MAKNKNGIRIIDAQPFERSKDENKHVRIFESMLLSPAFTSLSSEAVRVYLLLKNNYYGSCTTAICPYSYISENSDVHRNRVKRRLEELEAYGFIKVTEDTVKSKRGRPANLYKFVDGWKNVTDVDARKIQQTLKARWKEDNQRKARGRENLQKFLENEEE